MMHCNLFPFFKIPYEIARAIYNYNNLNTMCYFVRICSKGADLTVHVARALLQLVFLTSVLFVSP